MNGDKTLVLRSKKEVKENQDTVLHQGGKWDLKEDTLVLQFENDANEVVNTLSANVNEIAGDSIAFKVDGKENGFSVKKVDNSQMEEKGTQYVGTFEATRTEKEKNVDVDYIWQIVLENDGICSMDIKPLNLDEVSLDDKSKEEIRDFLQDYPRTGNWLIYENTLILSITGKDPYIMEADLNESTADRIRIKAKNEEPFDLNRK